MINPPPGYRFDAFADARMGRSLFDMRADDWLVPVPDLGDPCPDRCGGQLVATGGCGTSPPCGICNKAGLACDGCGARP